MWGLLVNLGTGIGAPVMQFMTQKSKPLISEEWDMM